MIEILLIIAIAVGLLGACIYLIPNTRSRGVRDISRTRRAADAAERDMDRLRDQVSDRERRRRQGPGRRF